MKRLLGLIGLLVAVTVLAGCASLEEPYFDENFREVPATDMDYRE